MSLILDALNKADNERKKSEAPSLTSIHSTGADPAILRRNRTIILALGFSVAVLAIALFSLLLKEKSTPPQPLSPPVSQESPQLAVTPAPERAQTTQALLPESATPAQHELASQPTAAPRNAELDTNSETYKQMQQKLIAEQYRLANQKQEASTPTANTAVDPKVASIYEQSRITPAPKPTATPAPLPIVQATAVPLATPIVIQPNTAQAASVQPQTQIVQKTGAQASHFTGRKTLSHYPELSSIGELPFSVQKNIPTIMYSEHAYSETNPSVTLNNTRRTNGQQIANELVLEEILEDGIILRYQSKKFKMDAMNSWINI